MMGRDIKPRTPDVPAAPPWMTALRSTVNTVVNSDTLERIVKAQVAKAEKGDERAARFVLELYGACQRLPDAPASPPDPIPTTAKPVEDLRRRVHLCVRELKVATPGQIAANLLVDVDDVEKILLGNDVYRRAGNEGKFELNPAHA